MRDDRGSVTLIMAAAMGIVALLVALSGDLALVVRARARAQAAADAAALAAAQELIVPSTSSPSQVAEEYADLHGAAVTRCRCDPAADEVQVSVELPVSPYLFGSTSVAAEARAVVEPAELGGLNPMFAARVGCLLSEVPGLSIVSGFRTHAEQAALYEEKPGLAAPPGHSMHELGLAADLGFPSPESRDLARSSAASCGLEFPMSYEPWHVQPIGLP